MEHDTEDDRIEPLTYPEGVEPPTEPAWYARDDAGLLYGPHDTEGDARAIATTEGGEDAAEFKRREIDCRVFDTEAIWDAFIERNGEAVWPDMPPDRIEGEDARELERRLAITFHAYLQERGTFDEFRALDEILPDKE